MAKQTTVHHVLKEDYDPNNPEHVYIGRDFYSRARKSWIRNVGFGNPFVIGKDGKLAEVIEKYRAWVLRQPELVARIRAELPGKRLYCFCKIDGKGPRCHGDTLKEIAEGEDE